MDKKSTARDESQIPAAALPTTFVSTGETAELTKMLELELEQAEQVTGGLAAAVRCCACHCCSCH